MPDEPGIDPTEATTSLPESDQDLFDEAMGDDWVAESDLPAPVAEVSEPVPVTEAPTPAPAPVVRVAAPRRPSLIDRRVAGRLRARRVRRLVRHVEPWSVLKMSLIFYFCLWGIMLIAGVILWSLAVGSGTIDNIENFVEGLFALDSFAFNADQIFRASAIGGLVLVVAGAGFTVLMAVLFNLISDVTGGIRVTVVEEETARPRPKRLRPRPGILRRSIGQAPAQPMEVPGPDQLPPETMSSGPLAMPEDFVSDADTEVASTATDR